MLGGVIINNLKSMAEIAEMYNVTYAGVKYWIENGLEYKIEKIIGKKPRKVIDPKDVEKFLNRGIRQSDKNKTK